MRLGIVAVLLALAGFVASNEFYKARIEDQVLHDQLLTAKARQKLAAPVGFICWQGEARVLYALNGRYLQHIGKPKASDTLNPSSCIHTDRTTAIAFGFTGLIP